jgi:competence protein ComEC
MAHLLVGLLLGLPLARFFSVPPLPLLLLSLVVLIGARHLSGRFFWYPLFWIAVTLAAWAYGEIRLPEAPEESLLCRPAREATLTIQIRRIYQANDRYGKTSGLGIVQTAPWESRLAAGDRIYFSFSTKKESTALYPGQSLRCTGLLRPLPLQADRVSQTKAAALEFTEYLRSLGVYYRFERNGPFLSIDPPPPMQSLYRHLNKRFREALCLGAPEIGNRQGIYIAMLLGQKNELKQSQKEAFKSTGTLHLFAISGLHIGVIALTLAQALRLARIPNAVAHWIGLSVLFLYVGVIGATPSAVRAFLMTAFYWISFSCDRQRSPFAALIGSAVFVLCVLPEQLWSVGFQLSYSVVASILLLGLPLNEQLCQHLRPYAWLPQGSWSQWHKWADLCLTKVYLLFSISLSAWLASAPFCAVYFGVFAPGGILLNMLLVNLATLVIVGGVISISATLLTLHPVAEFINHAAWVNLSLMEGLIGQFQKIPGAFVSCPAFPQAWMYSLLTGYYAVLLYSAKRRQTLRKTRPNALAP